MERVSIERVVRSAYAARVKGDLDGIMKHFGEAASFSLAGSVAVSPVPVAATGASAIREVLRRLVESIDFLAAEIVTMLVDGDRAAVHWRVRLRATTTGQEAQTELVDLIRFENGRIVAFHQFADTALANQLLRR